MIDHGLLLIDKEPSCTSHDVVQDVRRRLKVKKVGHCGTLDPSAIGLLLLTVGRATRLTRFLIQAPKVYEGTIRFGITTDTFDALGEVVAEAPVDALSDALVAEAMAGFIGPYQQLTPAYSAKKVKGQKFYELARRGEEVPAETKQVQVFDFGPLAPLAWDEAGRGAALRFRLSCSSGTYARTLAHDLGQKLGCGAHLEGLRRLQIGSFKLDDAVTVDELVRQVASAEGPGAAWIPFDSIPLPFEEVVLDPQQEKRIHHGQTVLVRDLSGEEGDWVKLVDRRRKFMAVGTVSERIGSGGVAIVQPRVVFQ